MGASCVFSAIGSPCTGSGASVSAPNPGMISANPHSGFTGSNSDGIGDAWDPVGSPSQSALEWLTLEAIMGVHPPAVVEDSPPMGAPPTREAMTANSDQSSHLAQSGASGAPPADCGHEASCAARLCSLFRDIDAIFVQMPTWSVLHVPLDHNLAGRMAEFAQRYASNSFMETIFTSMQRLLDLYPEAAALAVPMSPGPSSAGGDGDGEGRCSLAGCIHSLPIPRELRAVEEAVRPQAVDLAVASQLAACHLRLLDVLDRLVVCVFSCVRFTAASPDPSQPQFNLPDLKVGSFTPPKQSAVLMQAVLLKNLLEHLHGHFKLFADVVAAKAASSSSPSSSSPSLTSSSPSSSSSSSSSPPPPLALRALLLQTEVIGERHETSLGQIKVIGMHLLNHGWMG